MTYKNSFSAKSWQRQIKENGCVLEVWKTCKDFPKYAVSPDGLIKNLERKTLVRPSVNHQGIGFVKLMDEDDRRVTRSLGLLVAQAYLKPPSNKLYNSVIYLDGDKSNCAASNLMWRPRWYAIRYHKMFGKDLIAASVQIEETGEVFGTLRELCMKYGLDEQYTYIHMANHDPVFHYGFKVRRYMEA